MDLLHNIIKKIGDELKIKVTFLSDDWTTVLEKDNQVHYLLGYHFDINNAGISTIMDDKGLFFDLLKYHHLPIVEHKIIFKDYNKNDVQDYFNGHHQEIIVKGCVGSSGNTVYKIDKEGDLFKTIDELFIKQYSVALQPYYDILNEYRVIVLKNEVQLIYGKIKPFVLGDGKKDFQTLVQETNPCFLDKINNIEKPNYIPKLGEKIDLDFKFNLAKGGKSFLEIDKDLKRDIISLALEVTQKTNISFASIDIIHTKDKKLMVLEANAGIFMNNFIQQHQDGYDIAYNIYKKAIKKMFDIK